MRLSIAWRLGLSFLVLIIFSYVLGFKTVFSMQEMKKETTTIYQHPFVVAKNSRDIHSHIEEVAAKVDDIFETKDIAQIITLSTEVDLTIEEIKRHQHILQKALIGEKTSYAAYLATFEDFIKSEKSLMHLMQLGEFENAKRIYDKKFTKYKKRLLLNIIALEEHADAVAENLEKRSNTSFENALEEFQILLIFITLLGIIFAIFSYFHFIRPIRKFQSLIESIAIGDTSHKIYGLERNDEMGDIARSIALLNTHTANIANHTDKVAQGDYSATLDALSDNDKLVKSIQIMTKNLKENFLKNNKHNWIQVGKEHLSMILRENESRESLGDRILIILTEYTSAEIATLYLAQDDHLKLYNSYAYTNNENRVKSFRTGEGIVGQAGLKDEIKLITSVPKDYIQVKSGLGKSTPDNLILLPFFFHGTLKGVIEIGYFGAIEDKVVEFLDSTRESLGIAYENIESRIELHTALVQEQATSEELQAQEEELRVTNERLLAQGAALQSQKENLEKTSIDLAKKAVELEQTSKYKSEFLANMSHELRTPLNSLLILSSALAQNDDKNLSDDEVESAKVINESGENLLSLINDILDISKVEAGQMGTDLGEIQTDELLNNMKKRFLHMAEKNKIYMKFEVDENFPVHFPSDKAKVEQILTNFISNALKFTSVGGVSLILEKENDNLCFHIKDTGIGIPKEKQNLIFEAFQQADGSTSRNFGGTGLGLSIAMSFAKLLNGTITLKSEEDRGSTFTFILPYSSDTLTEKSTPSLSDKVLHESSPPFEDDRDKLDKSKALFLIVEDDEKFSKILYKKCNEHSTQALVASDGETGVLLAKKYDIKGIILDYMLPKMDGLEVLEVLKSDEKTKNIPVHIMSALENLADMKQLGAIGQSTKPITSQEIDTVLDSFTSKDTIVDKVLLFTNQVEEQSEVGCSHDVKTLEGKRVLLVDDDMRNTYSLAKIFRTKKIEAVVAPNGEKALQILSERSDIDIILMDIMMPKMDGYEVTQHIRKIETYKQVPIIAVTANAMVGDKEKCLESGANDYMSKPIDIEKLFVLIEMWLQR